MRESERGALAENAECARRAAREAPATSSSRAAEVRGKRQRRGPAERQGAERRRARPSDPSEPQRATQSEAIGTERQTITETAGRWLAGRSTRRSFLGKFGRAAVMVASGSSVATLLAADEAEARVCGQSGVSPKCATYDCPEGSIWGWCWYARGCCAGGGLKKICDCCQHNWPNVHGYCPSGTNVRCIVESCGKDPRVQTVSLTQLRAEEPVFLSTLASRARWAEGQGQTVVLVSVNEPLFASVVAPLANRDRRPLILVHPDRLDTTVIAQLQRLGTQRAILYGPGIGPGVEQGLTRYGIAFERAETGAEIGELSTRIAQSFRAAGARRAFAIEPAGTSQVAAPIAAAGAVATGLPLVVGVDNAKALALDNEAPNVLTYLVGPEAARRAGELPGGHPIFASTWETIAAEVMDAAIRVEGAPGARVALFPAPVATSSRAAALLSFSGLPLFHHAGTLAGARDPLFAHRFTAPWTTRYRQVALAATAGTLSTEAYYQLQSLVNGFEAHLLIGVAGQGLPVIDQPLPERDIGRARIASTGEREEVSTGYWSARALELED